MWLYRLELFAVNTNISVQTRVCSQSSLSYRECAHFIKVEKRPGYPVYEIIVWKKSCFKFGKHNNVHFVLDRLRVTIQPYFKIVVRSRKIIVHVIYLQKIVWTFCRKYFSTKKQCLDFDQIISLQKYHLHFVEFCSVDFPAKSPFGLVQILGV